MSAYPQTLRPRTINGVIEPGVEHPDHARQIRIFHDRGVLEAWTYVPIPRALPSRTLTAVAYIVPVDDREEEDTHHVVTRFEWCDDMDAFALAPISLGVAAEDVYRGRDLMEGVKHPAIRRLLGDVFTEPSAFFDFWTAPHRPLAPAGSLVRNAVVLGEHFRDRAFLPRDQRDLGIAYAVLRNIGNVWLHAAEDSAATRDAAVRVAFEKLDGPFAHFDAECPEYAAILRELLHAPMRPTTNLRAQMLLRYAAEVMEHDGPLEHVDLNR